MHTRYIQRANRLGEDNILIVRILHKDLLRIGAAGLELLKTTNSQRVLNIKDIVARSYGTIYAQASSCALDCVTGNGDIIAALTAGNKCKKLAGFLVDTAGESLKLIALDPSNNPIDAVKKSKLSKGKVKEVAVSDGGADFINGQKIGYYTSADDYFIATATVAAGVVTGVTAIDCSPSFFFELALANQLQNLKPAHKPANKPTIQVATRDGSNIPLTFTIVSGGAGYVATERLTLSDGTGSCIVSVSTVNASGAITALAIVTAAEAMALSTDLTVTGRTATDDTATLTVSDLVEESGYIEMMITVNEM